MLRGKPWNKLCDKSTCLLRIQVTNFLGNIYKRSDNFLMALFFPFFKSASSSTDLHRKLLTSCVSHKLSWLFLHILGCAGRLIDSLADLLTLTITHLLYRSVALIHCLIVSLLLKSDCTLLLKVLLANLLHGRFKLCNISVVALLCVLVGTLQDGLLLQGGHCLLLVHAAQPSIRVSHTTTEVNSTRNSFLLSARPGQLIPSSSSCNSSEVRITSKE